VSPSPAAASRVALLGICYDGSSSYLRGAAAAQPVIRQALWSEAGNPWTELGVDLSTAGLDDEGDLAPAGDENPAQVRAAIEAAVRQITGSGRRPLVLGGDHSITYPLLRGLRPFHPGLAYSTSTPTAIFMTSSRVIDTPTPAPSLESWRRDWLTAWCRWASVR
jgi:arginase family enzyme